MQIFFLYRYVGQVDYESSIEELRSHFAPCGTINRVTIICDKITGQSKGYAYIEFVDKEAAEKALELDESTFRGRQLKVLFFALIFFVFVAYEFIVSFLICCVINKVLPKRQNVPVPVRGGGRGGRGRGGRFGAVYGRGSYRGGGRGYYGGRGAPFRGGGGRGRGARGSARGSGRGYGAYQNPYY